MKNERKEHLAEALRGLEIAAQIGENPDDISIWILKEIGMPVFSEIAKRREEIPTFELVTQIVDDNLESAGFIVRNNEGFYLTAKGNAFLIIGATPFIHQALKEGSGEEYDFTKEAKLEAKDRGVDLSTDCGKGQMIVESLSSNGVDIRPLLPELVGMALIKGAIKAGIMKKELFN